MSPAADDPDTIHERIIAAGKQDRREPRGWVEGFLTPEADFVRAAALRTLTFYWRLPEHRDLAVRSLCDDPSDEVRIVAAMALGGYGYHEYRDDEMALLVTVALDAAHDEALRDAAFTAELAASRIPREQYSVDATIPGFEANARWELLVEAPERVGMRAPDRLHELASRRADATAGGQQEG